MCNQPTPEEQQVNCGRCGRVANPNDSWVHGWPLHGSINLGIHCSSSTYLEGGRWPMDEPKPDRTPAAMTKYQAQEVEFVWGPERRYRLCIECQQLLLEIIGCFFGMGAGEPKRVTPPVHLSTRQAGKGT